MDSTPEQMHHRITRHSRAAIFFTIATGFYLAILFIPHDIISKETLEVLKHAFGTLSVVAMVHLLDRMWLGKDLESQFANMTERFDQMKKNLVTQYEQQSEKLLHSASSLNAMNESAMVRVYSSRDQAAQDISSDLMDPDTTEVRIIGISLNDFIGTWPNPELQKAWRHISERIRRLTSPKTSEVFS